MTIQAFQKDNRVYFDFDKELKYIELAREVYPVKNLEYKGAGVRCYGSFYGSIMNCFGFATKVNVDGKEFYLNNKSLCQFVIRRFEVQKILKDLNEPNKIDKFKLTALHIHDLYLRLLGTRYPNDQIKKVLGVLKEATKASSINDTDAFEEMYLTLLEVAENALKPAVDPLNIIDGHEAEKTPAMIHEEAADVPEQHLLVE